MAELGRRIFRWLDQGPIWMFFCVVNTFAAAGSFNQAFAAEDPSDRIIWGCFQAGVAMWTGTLYVRERTKVVEARRRKRASE